MRPIVVVKLGGSLLDWPTLPDRLRAYLSGLGGVRPILVVGGGGMADVLRDLDTIHALGEIGSHALALRILDVTASLLVRLIPGTSFASTLSDLSRCWEAGLVPVLAPRLVLDDDDRLASAEALPHSWEVTTDSIAARVARLVGASELVLLKSAPPPADLATAIDGGWVDRHFLAASRGLASLTYVEFRREVPVVVRIA
jgi:aspartokinase-like uncharacterized kinase